jgi:hypothetical protein
MMNIIDFAIEYEEIKVRYREASNNIDSVPAFWNAYNHYPISLLINQKYFTVRDRLFKLLTTWKRIDVDTFTKTHKGYPYYFIGIALHLLDDSQSEIYLLDAAVT